MKTSSIFRTLFVVSSLVIGCVSLPAHGQFDNRTMSVNVPFAFEIGSKHMAPGKYTINWPMSNVLEISSRSDGAMILMHDGQSSKPSKTSKVVFDRYGDHYFLRQIWFHPQDNAYLECVESKAEKQVKRSELASSTKKASNVEIALLRIP